MFRLIRQFSELNSAWAGGQYIDSFAASGTDWSEDGPSPAGSYSFNPADGRRSYGDTSVDDDVWCGQPASG